MIYLDYAAATPLDPRVEEAMRPFEREFFGNPSSLHGAGRKARIALDEARDEVASALGAKSSEIFFTSGGTESNNLAIKGAARALRSKGKHILSTAIEHPSVRESCKALEREGFDITYISPDQDGIVDAEAVKSSIAPETILVSVMAANNEVGTLQPIEEIGKICRAQGIVFHSDAVQAIGNGRVSVETLNVDLLSLSSHKLYGPKGVGALYVRSGIRLQPTNHGGAQESGRRAGTENVAGIVGFATALALLRFEESDRLRRLRDQLIEGLLAIPGSRLHGCRERRLSNNVNVGFEGVRGETLFMALDLAGIAASTGSACSAGAVEASPVLLAMGYSQRRSGEAIRLTLGKFTTSKEIDEVVAALNELVPRLRR